MGVVWFIKMGEGTSGKCMVCMGDGVETRYVVAHDKTNGQWEQRNLMGHGTFNAHEERNLMHMPHLLKKLPIATR
jgi:hypothetical protein